MSQQQHQQSPQSISDLEKRREKNRDATRRHRQKQLKEKEHFKEEVSRLSQENLQLKEELRHAKSKINEMSFLLRCNGISYQPIYSDSITYPTLESTTTLPIRSANPLSSFTAHSIASADSAISSSFNNSESEKESYHAPDCRFNKRRLEATRPIAIKRPYEINLDTAPRLVPPTSTKPSSSVSDFHKTAISSSSDFLLSSLPTSTITTTSTSSVLTTPPCATHVDKPTSIAFDAAMGGDAAAQTPTGELITPLTSSIFMLSTLQSQKMVDGSSFLSASTGLTPCEPNIFCIVKSPTTMTQKSTNRLKELMSL